MLRRQAIRPLRKPLIVMTPKSLLRHKEAVSQLDELSSGGFQTVIDETDAIDPQSVKRVVMCSGKVFYDLRAARRERDIKDIAIIRIEQMYPFPRLDPERSLRAIPISDAVWVQEEPKPGFCTARPAPTVVQQRWMSCAMSVASPASAAAGTGTALA